MEFIEMSHKIPVIDGVDVLVLGGGPAGFGAAYTAALGGANTMLVEQMGALGGVATSGLMSHWTGDTRGGLYETLINRAYKFERLREKNIISDEEIKERAAKIGIQPEQIINPESLKIVLLEMVQEVGVKLRLYTFVSDVIVENNQITGVILDSKSGKQCVKAKIIIDATGDGDVAEKAGAPYKKGREEDGKMQPVTIMYKVAGVDLELLKYVPGFEYSYQIEAGDLQTISRKHISAPAGHVLIYPTTLPGMVTLNMTNSIGIDGTKSEDLTRGEMVCKSQIEDIMRFLRDYVPGFKKAFVVSSAPAIGVRETRHFLGDYTLSEADISEARFHEDWIVGKVRFNFDIHNLDGAGLDEHGVQKEFKQEKGYTIPYGCFLPQKIDNLLLAGRNISGTHKAHSSYRVMPICVNMGQGVGVAASLAVKENIFPRQIEVKKIQDILLSQGAMID